MWRVWIVAILLFCAPGVASAAQPVQTGKSNSEIVGQDQDRDILPEDNPGSFIEALEEDAKRKDHLFQLPGLDALLRPWYQFKAELAEQHGFVFGIAFTHLHQWANNTVAPEDEASGFDLDFDGVWNFRGRDTDLPTTLGFQVIYRDTTGTPLPPLLLFTQAGTLYTSAAGFSERELSLAQLWIQQKFGEVFGFRVGRLFPIEAYDFFPFKNFRSDFVDFNHVTTGTIPLPDYGLGAFVMIKPRPDVYFRVGSHDANADVELSAVDTHEGEFFTIFEAGFDPGVMPRQAGRPPFGDVHVSIWHQDKLKKAGVAEGWGVTVSGSQRFGRYTPFARYGYASGGANGPNPARHMANVGVVVDEIFGQSNDRIGVGFTWVDPADKTLPDQSAIDAFYRVQMTPEIAVSATLQVVFDPVRNPGEDEVVIVGVRSRFEL